MVNSAACETTPLPDVAFVAMFLGFRGGPKSFDQQHKRGLRIEVEWYSRLPKNDGINDEGRFFASL